MERNGLEWQTTLNKKYLILKYAVKKFREKFGVIFDQVKKDVLGNSTGMASSNILDKVDKVIEPNKILNPDNLDYGPDSEGKIRII